MVNINIGVLGHVDSGKTSLVKALSTEFSTASLDKHPQSRERGITIDLGFSAFTTPVPEHLIDQIDSIQYTLVDCPGHASLIKTIIGGAQIIDRMLLVVDVLKGIQTQTAECLVIGEILTDDIIVALNKIDQIPENQREQKIAEMTGVVQKALANTRFNNPHIVPVAACVGGGENASVFTSDAVNSMGLDKLVDIIRTTTKLPDREDSQSKPLMFSVDHGFPIKGQGTILTGTVLQGHIQVGDNVELPELGEQRKVKSMQMFRKSVNAAASGDRVAIAVTNIDAKLIERAIVASPGSMHKTYGAVFLVRKVKYFTRKCVSKSKIHVTIGHQTILSTVTFFGSKQLKQVACDALGKALPLQPFDKALEYEYDDELLGGGKAVGGPFLHWALVEFDHPVYCHKFATAIASRLDSEVDTKMCRIAFYGNAMELFQEPVSKELLSHLRVFKWKQREGSVDRVSDKEPDSEGRVFTVVGKDMFSKDSVLERFLRLNINTSENETGILESTFGSTGKYKVYFKDGAKLRKGDKLFLRYKKYVFDPVSHSTKTLPQ